MGSFSAKDYVEVPSSSTCAASNQVFYTRLRAAISMVGAAGKNLVMDYEEKASASPPILTAPLVYLSKLRQVLPHATSVKIFLYRALRPSARTQPLGTPPRIMPTAGGWSGREEIQSHLGGWFARRVVVGTEALQAGMWVVKAAMQ